ncbi:MAG: hypothetical protein Q9179_006669, partial [Wetmoreana sp. 5 TL-2023]
MTPATISPAASNLPAPIPALTLAPVMPPAPASVAAAVPALAAAPLPTAASAPAAAAASAPAPEPELSPISKGFVGKGPRSRPGSARLSQHSTSAEEPSQVPQDLTLGQEHFSSGNNAGSSGETVVDGGGSGGVMGPSELSSRPSSGKGNGTSQGTDTEQQQQWRQQQPQQLSRRRSRGGSLSREQAEFVDKPAAGNGSEVNVQQGQSSAAAGEMRTFRHQVYICK